MKTYLKITALFFVVVFSSVIFPALARQIDNIALLAFFPFVILYVGISRGAIIAGLCFSFITEIIFGIHSGTIMISFLITFAFVLFLNRFLHIRPISKTIRTSFIAPLTIMTILNSFLFLIMYFVFLFVERVIYGTSIDIAHNPIVVEPFLIISHVVIMTAILITIPAIAEHVKIYRKSKII